MKRLATYFLLHIFRLFGRIFVIFYILLEVSRSWNINEIPNLKYYKSMDWIMLIQKIYHLNASIIWYKNNYMNRRSMMSEIPPINLSTLDWNISSYYYKMCQILNEGTLHHYQTKMKFLHWQRWIRNVRELFCEYICV